MSYSKLMEPGQIHKGDKLIIIGRDGRVTRSKAKAVLNQNTDKEEIVINLSRNIYFIVSMFLEGSSWAKAVAYSPVSFREDKE